MDRRAFRKIIPAAVAACAVAGYLLWGNTTVKVSEYSVAAPGLPEAFSGLRIAHVSDLHDSRFGTDNRALLELIAQSRPDVIFMTGDMLDSVRTDVEASARFICQAAAIAPAYYIQGNHEAKVPQAYEQLKQAALQAGVTVLEDSAALMTRGDAVLSILGMTDREEMEDELILLHQKAQGYTVLLAHRPERIGYYAGADMDLVFCGHAHGGQFRLPLIGGLYSPGQGVFPVYDSGVYTVEDTRMVVSRGLGNSRFPIRLNNRPELVVVELTALPEP